MSPLNRWISALLVISLHLVHTTGSAAAECDERSSYALLIGINDYKPSHERNLEGPINDVTLMRGILLQRFKIPSQNIMTITDSQATHTGIRQAFEDLAKRETACDFVYIHYSGHGADFDNKDKAKQCDKEERDQTWVSYGARSGEYPGGQDLNSHDVLDDEINDWLTSLDTDNYVFVSDSCHSGSVHRGDVDGVRSAEDYTGQHPLAQAALRCEGDKRGIKIGAARDIEEAIETKRELDNKEKTVFGRFTWYWAKALARALPSEHWSDVFDRTYALVTTDEGSRKQFPQLTGNANRPIFGGEFEEPERTVQVIGIGEDGRTVTLAAGAIANMTEGSQFSLFRRGEPITPDRPSLEITEVGAAQSIGKVLQGVISKGDLVIETRHAYAFEPYSLFIDPSCGGAQIDLGPREQDRPLFEHLRSSLGELVGFEMAESSETADMIVCVLRPDGHGDGCVKPVDGAPLPHYCANARPAVWVVDQGLSPIHERLKLSLHKPKEDVAKLSKNLKAYLRGQEVIRFGLDERPGEIPEMLLYVNQLRAIPASECAADSPCRELPFEGYQDRRYRSVSQVELDKLATLGPQKDDILEFRARNNSNSSLYVYVLNISKDLAVNVIYPNPHTYSRSEYPKFKPEDDRVLDYAAWLLDEGDDDWFKLIASKHPIDVNVFVREGLAEYKDTRSLKSAPSALEELVSAALHTRGQSLKPTPVQAWFVKQSKLTAE